MTSPYDAQQAILKLCGISLEDEGTIILKNLDLKLYPGAIHAIVGDHGSGKSMIARIINGEISPTQGIIEYLGRSYSSMSLEKARRLGIQSVHQDIALIGDFTVAENLFLPDRIMIPLPYVKRRLMDDARSILNEFGFQIDESVPVGTLHLSEKIAVSMLRAIIRRPRLLILDEALEKMTGDDRRRMIDILERDIRERGLSVLCLSHTVDDIYDFTDTVTIIRRGSFFLTDKVDNIDRINLIKLCYTQMPEQDGSQDSTREFYQLLKYNEAILQELPVNLVVLDDKSKIKLINRSGRHFFQAVRDTYRGRPVDDLFPEGNDQCRSVLDEALSSSEEKSFYSVPFELGGDTRITNLRTLPIFDGAFRIGTIVIVEDVTERESLREHVNLSEKLASVGLLAAGVAHEINNPLEIIYNHLNYMRLTPDRAEIGKTIDELEGEMTYIRQIVSNLISFSDNTKEFREDFSINELIDDLLNLIRFNARHEGISLQFNASADNPILRANRNEIKQVMLNLIKNSFEAMPVGGIVHIETSRNPSPDGDSVVIRVADEGKGMDRVGQGDIFLPFYSTKDSKEGNMGLGLSVSYGIIKKYGGAISARNLPLKGCVFTIELPASQVRRPPEVSSAGDSESDVV